LALGDDRSLTVGTWLQTWLTLLARAGRSPKTLANYRGHVRDVWDPTLGDIPLRDLRRVDLEQVLVELLKPTDPTDCDAAADLEAARSEGRVNGSGRDAGHDGAGHDRRWDGPPVRPGLWDGGT
jgi:hypothetical protein